MKHTLLYIATTLLLASCGQEELPLGEQALGYLSLSAVEVEASDVQLISTRASETDDLMVTLTPTNDDGKLTECPCSETISCQPGTYTLEIYNQAYKDKADAAQYYYKHEDPVVITEGETNDDVEPISVPMINFGVKLQLPEGFDTWFPTYTYTVNGKELKDGEIAYFDYSSDAEIEYTLTATNKDNEPFKKEGSNSDDCWKEKTITAGTIYIISYAWETQTWKVE